MSAADKPDSASARPLRSTPASIRHADGKTTPARIVGPAWTRDELEGLVNTRVRQGLLTREQADRLITEGRRLLRADGMPRRTRGRSR